MGPLPLHTLRHSDFAAWPCANLWLFYLWRPLSTLWRAHSVHLAPTRNFQQHDWADHRTANLSSTACAPAFVGLCHAAPSEFGRRFYALHPRLRPMLSGAVFHAGYFPLCARLLAEPSSRRPHCLAATFHHHPFRAARTWQRRYILYGHLRILSCPPCHHLRLWHRHSGSAPLWSDPHCNEKSHTQNSHSLDSLSQFWGIDNDPGPPVIITPMQNF